MLSINQVLQQGRYHILSRFEHEETGIIYQAFDNVLRTKVIIKETSFDLKTSPNAYKYPIAKQIENLSSIKHESFPQIYDFFSEVNHQFLVTEAVEGQNVKELLGKNQKPFPLFTVLNWTEQLLDALNYLHSTTPPIIHGDITPYNLTLAKDNKVKLQTLTIIKDFSTKQGKQFSDLQLPYLPLEALWETLDYASQKVILNSYDEQSAETLESPLDERSDVYSIGATIYYLVTGKIPNDALERSIELLEGKEDSLASPNAVNSQIPRNFSTFLMKALEIKRENRFESAMAMRTALQPMLDLMKKIEMETQKAVEDPKVRESALHEVELARQALKKQKEEQLKQTQEVLNPSTVVPPQQIVEAPKPEVLTAQQTLLQEIEKAKEAAIEEKEPERLVKVQENTEPEQQIQPQIQEEVSLKVKVERHLESVLVVPAEEPEVVETVKLAPADTLPDTQPLAKPAIVKSQSESDLFADIQPPRKSSFWMIPVFGVVLVLLIGGFFGFKFLNSSSAENKPQPVAEQQVVNESAKPATEPPQNQNSSVDTSAVSPSNVETQPSPTVPDTEAQKTTESTVKAKKVTPGLQKTSPTTAKTPVPKKKEVTVDDIINDN